MLSSFGFFLWPLNTSRTLSYVTINANKNNVRNLAAYIKFKAAFPNSLIYHYRGCHDERRLRLSMSINTINHYIEEFIRLGWATRINGTKSIKLISKLDLSLKSCEGTKKKPKEGFLFPQIPIGIDIITYIRSLRLRTYSNQKNWSKSKKIAFSPKVQDKVYKIEKGASVQIRLKEAGKVMGLKSKSGSRNALKKMRGLRLLRMRRDCAKPKFVGFCNNLNKWENRELWWNSYCPIERRYKGYSENINFCFLSKNRIFYSSPYRITFTTVSNDRRYCNKSMLVQQVLK